MASCTSEAEPEDDLAPAGHGALDPHGATAFACRESLTGVETDRIDGALHLPAEIRVMPRDDAREPVNGADGFNDVIEDAKVHGGSLGGRRACGEGASVPIDQAS